MIPKITVSGLGDYVRNEGYKTGSINYEFETKTFNYDRGIRLMADVMDVEEVGVLDCFVEAGGELRHTQVAPEADAFVEFGEGQVGGFALGDFRVTHYEDEGTTPDLSAYATKQYVDDAIAALANLEEKEF